MAHVTSATKRRTLRAAYAAAQAGGEMGLRYQLVAFEANLVPLTQNGTITSSSGSGESLALAMSRHGQNTVQEMADAATELIDLYDSVKGTQLSLSPPGAVDDATMYSLMYASPECRGVSNATSNYMWLMK